MKKINSALFLLFLLSLSAFAQTTLPTSWSFATTTLPTGWSAIDPIPAYYTGSGNTPPAYKFDATGDQIIVFFANNPGALTYYIGGNSFTGSTFLVEESSNGTTWTTLHSYTTLSGTYAQYTDIPNNASRYIRFNYSNKVSGNVGLDDVSIALGAAGPAQEINVKQGSTTYLSGSMYSLSSAVGVSASTTFTVENLGTTNTLNISAATITGTNASDYTVSSFPSTVAGASTGNLVVDFNPAAAGTRTATLTIANDDSDENPYTIELYGVGGSYATEPTAQATNLVFSNIKSYTFDAAFTAASPAPDGYIVLRKKGAAITETPTDGIVYQRGDTIGGCKVVFSGTATSFTPNNIISSTDYYFAVFTYNGPGVYRNYLTTSPLAANTNTLGSMMSPTYYNGISTTNATFLADLHTKINNHTHLYYSNYGPAMVPPFLTRDTAGNQRVITCVYSGENKVYTEPFDWTATGYSREHTYCHNWMPTDPSTTLPEYEDYHQLFPTNQNNANAIRSNYPLGEVVNATFTYMGCKLGTDIHGHTVFEPRDSHKGDAARAMMYEATCYTTVSNNSWALPNPISQSIPYGEDQNILKKWHYQDPPDAWEIARNDFVESLQGNRNPFIDSVQFACYIDFTTMTKLSGPNVPCNAETLGISEKQNTSEQIVLAPNPNSGAFSVHYLSVANQKATVKLMDMLGRTVYTNEVKVNNGFNAIEVNLQDLNKGVYMFELTSENSKKTEKVVIK